MRIASTASGSSLLVVLIAVGVGAVAIMRAARGSDFARLVWLGVLG